MTWTWTLTKIGIGLGLSAVSSNPIGWAIGVPTATLIRLKNEENLNSSTLTLTDKEDAQRWIEVASDYQLGAGFGIVFKGLAPIINSELTKKTLSIGRNASKEIATQGFKTELARSLINDGINISKFQYLIKNASKIHELEETLKGLGKVTKNLSESTTDEEFIESANILIQAQNLFIDDIENSLIEKRNLLNVVKKNILKLNKKNVEFFIKYQKNKDEHRKVNHKINKILTRIKTIQKKLHKDHNCCDECRFCQGGE